VTTSTTDRNTATVLAVYDAFGRGDVPFILDQLADDVVWEEGMPANEVPWLQPGTGKGHVTSFFQALAENLEFESFEPRDALVGGDTVAVTVYYTGRGKQTGVAGAESPEVHLWRFDESGKVRAFRHVVDMTVHRRMAHGT
jgi:uncharacterized protein